VVISGPVSSQPHRFGVALAKAVGERPGLSLSVDGSADSVRAMQMVQDGHADLGFAFGDAAYLAFTGGIARNERPLTGVRAIAMLQPRPLHVLVPANSAIRRVTDLRGHRVAINPQDLSAALVLGAFGAPVEELALVPFPSQGSAAAFRSGTVD